MTMDERLFEHVTTIPAPQRNRRWWWIVVGAVTGGTLVALISVLNQPNPPPPPPPPPGPSAAEVHAQNVLACSGFQIAYDAFPSPQVDPLDDLTPAAFIYTVLARTPDADPDIRAAIQDQADMMVAGAAALADTQTRGYVQPREYDAQKANDGAVHVGRICRGH